VLFRPVEILGIQSCLTRCDIRVGCIDEVSPLEDLPEEVEDEEDWDADVGSEEVSNIPMLVARANKDIEAVEDNDQAEEDQGNPGQIGLEVRPEHQGVTVNALCLEGGVELDVGQANGAPSEEGGDGGQVLEPCEDESWSTISDRQIRQERNKGCEEHTIVWYSTFAALKEESWGLSVLCKGKEIAGSGVQECVGRRRSRGQNDSVDDGGKNWDTGVLNTNNPRGGSSASSTRSLGTKEILVIRRNENTDGEGSKNVEEQNTPENSANCLGDVFARVLGLTCSNGNKFNSSVGECSIDEHGEESQESTSVSSRIVLLHCAGVFPVTETQAVMFWSTTEIDDECHD